MSDTVDKVDAGVLLVPNATGDNTTETYAIYYPDEGFLATGYESIKEARHDLTVDACPEAMIVKVTIERV